MEQRNHRKCTYYLKTMLLSLCTAEAFVMNFTPSAGAVMKFSEIYPELLHGFGGTAFIATIVWAALFSGAIKIDEMKKERNIPLLWMSLIVAMIWLMGKSFLIDHTLHALGCSYVQIMKSIVYTMGIAYLLFQLAVLFQRVLDVCADQVDTAVTNASRMGNFYHKHPFGGALAALLVGMLPHLILSYPTRMSYDARNQLGYYFDLWPFSSHHPPFSSWVMGKVVSLGITVNGTGGVT